MISTFDIIDDEFEGIDALIVTPQQFNHNQIEKVLHFVKGGGGLVTGLTGWAQNDLSSHPCTKLIAESGICFTTKHSVTQLDSSNINNVNRFSNDLNCLKDVHAGDCWKLLLAKNRNELIDTDTERIKQLQSVVNIAKDSLPFDHPLVRAINRNHEVSYHDKDVEFFSQNLPDGYEKHGYFGPLSIFGQNAFPIAVGCYSTDSCIHAIGGATTFGNGRLIGFSHGNLTNPGARSNHKQMLTNAVKWCGQAENTSSKLHVGLLKKNYYVTEWANENEFNFQLTEFSRVDSAISSMKASDIDVLLLANIHEASANETVKVIKNFVRNGGGLVTAGTGWAQHDMESFPANKIFWEAGISWTNVSGMDPLENDKNFSLSVSNMKDICACEGWDLIYAQMTKQIILPENRVNQIASVIGFAVDVKGNQNSQFYNNLKSDLMNTPDIIPTPSNVIQDATEKFLLKYKINCLYNNPEIEGNCVPYASTEYFPGLVSPNAKVLENFTVKLPMKNSAWYSTGLYSPPGKEIVVSFPNGTGNADLQVQIGSHHDDITGRKGWERCPNLVVKKSILPASKNTVLRNTFGGLVYVNLLNDLNETTEVEASISGCIKSPRFVLGKTTQDEWEHIRCDTNAPWGEFQTCKFILTLPSSKLVKVDNPTQILEHWDKVMDAIADLVGIDRNRKRAERIVADVQISVGYMHSGYPIMMLTDESVDTVLSLEKLKGRSAWGHYHELGHNHQKSSWTFKLATEITNNLIVLYIFEEVCGITAAQARSDKFAQQNLNWFLENYRKNEYDYNWWKHEPFTGLIFYFQLKERYGWDVYKNVFKAYQKLDPLPESEQDKVDEWLKQFSFASGQNLAPLFKDWGILVSDDAVNAVKHLPVTDQHFFSLYK